MTEANDLKVVLKDGFRSALEPVGFEAAARQVWVRPTSQVLHVVALLKRREFYDVQWGLLCPDVVGIMWEAEPNPHDVSQAIVSGTPGSIRQPAMAQSFSVQSLELDPPGLALRVREDMAHVASWMNDFKTRRDIRDYLLENRDATDRRAFVVPAKLPLKLLTAAALAAVDRDPAACDLLAEAESALEPFKEGKLTAGRLARLRAAIGGLCD